MQRVGFGAHDVYPIAWPFTHIGGVAMVVTALVTGVRLVLFDTFDPATTPERMAAHGPTVLGSATPFFRAFLDAERRHAGGRLFDRVRACCGGGASIPGAVNQELVDTFGVPGVICSYGLTEFPNATCEEPGDPLLGFTVGPVGPVSRLASSMPSCNCAASSASSDTPIPVSTRARSMAAGSAQVTWPPSIRRDESGSRDARRTSSSVTPRTSQRPRSRRWCWSSPTCVTLP